MAPPVNLAPDPAPHAGDHGDAHPADEAAVPAPDREQGETTFEEVPSTQSIPRMIEKRLILDLFKPGALSPQLEIFAIGDPQFAYLDGRWSVFRSNTVDSFIDPSVRPLALDLFSFTIFEAYLEAFIRYAKRVDRPVVVLIGGDIGDRGCNQEPQIASRVFEKVGLKGGELPPNLKFVVIPGNHDNTYIGNFRRTDEAFGLVGEQLEIGPKGDPYTPLLELLGGPPSPPLPPYDPYDAFVENIWGPACGGESNILTKEEFSKWLAGVYGISFDKAHLIIDRHDRYRYRIAGKRVQGIKETFKRVTEPISRLWKAPEAHDELWEKTPVGTELSIIEMEQKTTDPNQNWIVVSSLEAGGAHIVGLDSSDQIDGPLMISGLLGSISDEQGKIALSETDHHTAPLITATHFPFSQIYGPTFGPLLKGRERAWRRSPMRRVLDERGQLNISFHTHANGTLDLAGEFEKPQSHLKRKTPFIDFTVGSTTDYPNTAGKVGVFEDKFVTTYFTPEASGIEQNPRVMEEFEKYRYNLVAYREQASQITNPKIRRVAQYLAGGAFFGRGKLGTALDIVSDRGSSRYEIVMFDTLPLMEYQFREMLACLESVSRLLDQEIEDLPVENPKQVKLLQIKEGIDHHLETANKRYAKWQEKFTAQQGKLSSLKERIEEYQKKYGEEGCADNDQACDQERLTMARDLTEEIEKEYLDLFVIPCEEGGYCLESTQALLQAIPSDTDAWEFMYYIALKTAKADYDAKDHAGEYMQFPRAPLTSKRKK